MKKIIRLLSAVCALCLLALPAAVAEQASEEIVTYDAIYSSTNPIPEIAANVRPSVVEVLTSVESWDASTRESAVTPLGSASGCYIRGDKDGGYILTNYHVVESGDVYTITWLNGTEMDAELVGYDNGTDIAILRFEGEAPDNALPIPLGDSDALQIGELCIAIGNPGSGRVTLTGTVTAGIISGLERSANANNFSRSVSVIQTDAAINVGNSGGALLNARGELVGIPTLKFMYTYDTVFEGLGFCIPINAVSAFVDQIIDTGVVVRPRMGMTVAAVDGPDEPMKKFPPAGIQVYEVEKGGPAEQAGIAEGDIITYANGNRVYTFLDLTVELDKCKAGDTIDLKICRYYDEKGELTGKYEELEFTVTLAMLD